MSRGFPRGETSPSSGWRGVYTAMDVPLPAFDASPAESPVDGGEPTPQTTLEGVTETGAVA